MDKRKLDVSYVWYVMGHLLGKISKSSATKEEKADLITTVEILGEELKKLKVKPF